MLRPLDSILIDTVANFTTHDPIIPYGIFAVNSDGSGFKLGNGIDVWSALSYQGGNSIGSKQVQTSREPANNELLLFCESTDKWVYRLQHCFDSVTNWASYSSVFPTSTMLIETDDITGIPTGRFKIGDGATAFPTLPWFGADFDTSLWSAGEGIEFNGAYFEPATYLKPTELQVATIPSGKFHRDDGSWASISISEKLDSIEADYASFGTVYIGGFPTESTTVTLTSDGVDLFSDGNKVWTQHNDGTGSGLDADTLDGHHSTEFLTATVINALEYKGAINCSTSPLFPTGEVGDFYKVSDSGTIGGEFGTAVLVDYNIICNTDTPSGDYASVGTYWNIFGNDSSGYVSGPESSVNNNIAVFNGTSGVSIIDSGHAISEFAVTGHTHDYSETYLGINAKATDSYKLGGIDVTDFATTGNLINLVTGPASAISGNLPILDSTGKIISDSGYSPTDFATSGDIEVVDDDAFMYAIIFGG